MNGIWITWERQRRNSGISSALGWPLFEILPNRSRFIRYLLCPLLTVAAILRHRPEVVIAQNPSIVLALLAVTLKHLFRYRCLIDAHNSGLFPAEGESRILMLLSRWIQRRADLTIVSNEELIHGVEGNGGRAFALPDRIPEPGLASGLTYSGKRKIAFVCTFSEDEPYGEVFEAARRIPSDISIHVTGRYGAGVAGLSLPDNITLLGFVPDLDYWALLNQADAILVLTLRESCLLCGAYEGTALGKPLILSGTRVLKSYFHSGCVYVEATAESIAAGIEEALAQSHRLEGEMAVMRTELDARWQERIEVLKNLMPRQSRHHM